MRLALISCTRAWYAPRSNQLHACMVCASLMQSTCTCPVASNHSLFIKSLVIHHIRALSTSGSEHLLCNSACTCPAHVAWTQYQWYHTHVGRPRLVNESSANPNPYERIDLARRGLAAAGSTRPSSSRFKSSRDTSTRSQIPESTLGPQMQPPMHSSVSTAQDQALHPSRSWAGTVALRSSQTLCEETASSTTTFASAAAASTPPSSH